MPAARGPQAWMENLPLVPPLNPGITAVTARWLSAVLCRRSEMQTTKCRGHGKTF